MLANHAVHFSILLFEREGKILVYINPIVCTHNKFT